MEKQCFKGTDIPTPKVPESFKVLIKELQAIGLNVVPVGATVYNEAPENIKVEEKVEKEAKELEQSLGVEEVVVPDQINTDNDTKEAVINE